MEGNFWVKKSSPFYPFKKKNSISLRWFRLDSLHVCQWIRTWFLGGHLLAWICLRWFFTDSTHCKLPLNRNSNMSYVHPENWGRKKSPILTFAYFSDGLVKNHQREDHHLKRICLGHFWNRHRKFMQKIQVGDLSQLGRSFPFWGWAVGISLFLRKMLLKCVGFLVLWGKCKMRIWFFWWLVWWMRQLMIGFVWNCFFLQGYSEYPRQDAT